MHDAGRVRGQQAFRQLRAEVKQVAFRQRAADQLLRQGAAGDVFGDEVSDAVVGVEIIDGGDVGMIEAGESERLVTQAVARGLVGQRLGGEDLDRDLAVEVLVARAEDLAHAAGADLLLQTIVAEHRGDNGNQLDGRIRRRQSRNRSIERAG
jgi:hypothetical protein